MDPIFWLALSLFLVAISLTAVLVVTVPAIQEIGRAARSVEKLFDTLSRDLPPTLESIRLTGLEIAELTDDVTDSVKSAAQAAKQVEESLVDMRQQAQSAQGATRSVVAGVKAAWQTFTRPAPESQRKRRPRLSQRLPEAVDRSPVQGSQISQISHSSLQPQNDAPIVFSQESESHADPDLRYPLQLPQRSSRKSRNLSKSLEIPEEVELHEVELYYEEDE